MTTSIKIHLAPQKVAELFKETQKETASLDYDDDFRWSIFEGLFFRPSDFSINGVIEAAIEKNAKEITMPLKSLENSKKIKLLNVAFCGTPAQMEKELKKILEEVKRRSKLKAFK